MQNDESSSALAPPSDDDGLDDSSMDNNGKSNAPPPTQINKLKYTGPSHIRKVGACRNDGESISVMERAVLTQIHKELCESDSLAACFEDCLWLTLTLT